MSDEGALAASVGAMMGELRGELAELISIPSIAGPDRPHEPILAAHDRVAALLSDAGVEEAEPFDLPDASPLVTGRIPAPDGAPTVLLYGHYDVVPAGDEDAWLTPPFEPVERDGAIYGRGSADSKANVIAHVGALRAWEGRPPVGIEILIEGQEELGSSLNDMPPGGLDRFACDAILVADSGSVRPGVPTLTIALRGVAQATVEVRTLQSPKHSGQYGGAAPDALLALIRALSSLQDDHGDVAVAGLLRDEWVGAPQDEAEFRELAEVLPGVPLTGTGDVATRIWSAPAVTVTGLDALPVSGALNAVPARARARVSLRVHPAQEAAEAQRLLVEHLARALPFGIEVAVEPGEIGDGFSADPSGPAYSAARGALSAAWGAQTVLVGSGGSIPVVSSLQRAIPQAEVLVLGACDGHSNIHGPNERVLIDELERSIVAEADFFARFAAA
ncbi:MAG TPA: M20/M25/M40 family metallo-hydrolase [Solirubrobacteraceae bacterium]|nr:M20/M25/M40 family metallo-hydrolase [Solirubrobacteraceae bacterium]